MLNEKSYNILIAIGAHCALLANSITILPDTLSTTLEYSELTTETVTITNSNALPVNLDISILEQPTANRLLPFYAERFTPENLALVQDMEPDIQYQDENGNWVEGVRCGTPQAPDGVLAQVQYALVENRAQRSTNRNLVNVQVAWHVIHASNGAGNISNDMIVDQIDIFNDAYAPYDIFFTLVSVDYTMNDNWFGDMDQYESAYKQQLNIDPVHHLNIYSGNMPGLLGWSYLPYQWSEGSYMHGVCILYSCLPGGTSYPYNAGDSAVHEVGHYLGLEHTFRNGCSANNDYVDDTPQEDNGNNISSCNNTDTCPNDPGMDPVHNFMTYTDDACLDEFTTGQGDRMEDMIATYRPGLLENPVAPEWIYTTTNVIQVPANSTVDLDITFDGTTVVGGDYAAHVYFEENTMDTTVVLPAFLYVAGIANLDLSFATVVDTLYPNEFTNHYLEITFNGEDPLIYEFTYDISWLTVLGADGELENGETDFVTFSLNSLFMLPGDYEGEVILNSNQGSIPIQLHLTVLEELGLIAGTMPEKFAVSNNFPNPFNPVTTFSIDLPAQSSVNAAVYDLYGRKIATLLHSVLHAGSYNLSWQGRNDAGVMVSAGMYFLKVDTEYNHHVQKMIFMK